MGAPVFGRLLLCLGALTLGTSVGVGQAGASSVPEPCQVSSSDALLALEARRLSLEREVTLKTAAKAPELASEAKELEQNLRSRQEELLEVIFQIDCQRSKEQLAPRSEQRARGVLGSEPVIEVTTYYATNRKQTSSIEASKVYGLEFETALHYGRAIVTIPRNHTPGSLELPALWKFERDADRSKHFVLKAVVPLSAEAGRKEIADKLEGMSSKSLLVFVHGYNTGFTEAALRTAQMAHDLRFPGMAFFYSWPSANQIRTYWQDEETARLSESVFEQLIEELSQLPVTDIYIVAHSMGNRIVGHALQARVDKGKETNRLRELLLAAPDINADLFRAVIAPKLAAMRDTHTTVYAASSDLALKASKAVHGFRRVGETAGGVFTYPGLESIDASNATTMKRGYGHSYLMDSSSVLKDIKAIIEQRVGAKLRGLSEAGTSPNSYWLLQ